MKKRRKIKSFLPILCVAVVLIGIVILQHPEKSDIGKTIESENLTETSLPNITSLSTKGFTRVSISVDAIYLNYAKVSIHAGCYEIDAQTDPYVAQAILYGLRHKVYFRPTVYDVMKDIFDNFGIKVLMLKINKVVNNTFIGSLYIQKGNKILSLDIKPSDGTAIALRVGAPIYINDTLIKKYGHYIC